MVKIDKFIIPYLFIKKQENVSRETFIFYIFYITFYRTENFESSNADAGSGQERSF